MNLLYLIVICFVFAGRVLGQNVEKTISDCISNNVTLMFDLPESKDQTVESYLWYKYDGQGDPSFARYKVAEKEFRIFRDDVQDRLRHDHKDSSQLKNVVLLNVKKSDASKYVLVINYANVTLQSLEAVLHLSVQDICFEKPKEMDGCVLSTCFTGENGKLSKNNEESMMETVNGYTVIKNCEKGVSVNYTCCNADSVCKEQMFKVPGGAQDSDKSGAIPIGAVIGIIVVVLLIALVVAVFLVIKKRRSKGKGKEQKSSKDEKGEMEEMLNGEKVN